LNAVKFFAAEWIHSGICALGLPFLAQAVRHGTNVFRQRNTSAFILAANPHFPPKKHFFPFGIAVAKDGKPGSKRGSCRGEFRTKKTKRKK
jgi:hypothetical protein